VRLSPAWRPPPTGTTACLIANNIVNNFGGKKYSPLQAPRNETAGDAFLAAPGQGVNSHAGTWHAPLLALAAAQQSAVVDRIGDRFSDGENLEESRLPEPVTVVVPDS